MSARGLVLRALIGAAMAAVMLFASMQASARECRTIEQSFGADGLQGVSLGVHVGELDVKPSDDGAVHVAVEVCARNSWFGLRKRKVADAELKVDRDDGTLELAIRQDKYEETWTVRMPAALALTAEMGVGEVTIAGLQKDIELEVGVGDAEIAAHAEHYGRISGEAGVGDIEVVAAGGNSRSERAVVSDSVTWTADDHREGAGSIDAEVGVGDVQITLD